MTGDTGIESRAEAIRIIARWLETQEFPDRSIARVPPSQRAFVMELTYGVARWALLLDEVLAPRLRRRPPPHVEAALMLGACQLLVLDGVAEYAAIHATVEALKIVGDGRAPIGLANAVLRDIQRNLEPLRREISTWPTALRTSHPPELVEEWTELWGARKAERICDWNNLPAEISVVTLPDGPLIGALGERFERAGIVCRPHPECEEAIVIGHGTRAEDLPGFAEGEFAIQDPATLEATRLLDAQPGHRVLDACAAPGGKAARLARQLRGEGELVALERHRDRIPLLRETLQRICPQGESAGKVIIKQGDATKVMAEELGGQFDRILLDVPCSNSGVLRRRPDARWRVNPGRTEKLTRLQDALLDNAARLLAPGGRIVYSTCSLQPAENEERIERFLERHPELRQMGSVFRVPPGTDGAFAAALG